MKSINSEKNPHKFELIQQFIKNSTATSESSLNIPPATKFVQTPTYFARKCFLTHSACIPTVSLSRSISYKSLLDKHVVVQLNTDSRTHTLPPALNSLLHNPPAILHQTHFHAERDSPTHTSSRFKGVSVGGEGEPWISTDFPCSRGARDTSAPFFVLAGAIECREGKEGGREGEREHRPHPYVSSGVPEGNASNAAAPPARRAGAVDTRPERIRAGFALLQFSSFYRGGGSDGDYSPRWSFWGADRFFGLLSFLASGKARDF